VAAVSLLKDPAIDARPQKIASAGKTFFIKLGLFDVRFIPSLPVYFQLSPVPYGPRVREQMPIRQGVNNQGATSSGSFQMMTFVSRFMSDESGATAIEYGLIAAGIAIVIIAAVRAVGTGLTANFNAAATAVTP